MKKIINKAISKYKPFVFYIADSLGCIDTKDIYKKIQVIKKKWKGGTAL